MGRVLVIEDDRDLQKVLAYNLSAEGHEVTSAYDGSAGLRLARDLRPDLVLLDLMLPGVPGIEILRALKAEKGTAASPVIICSARGEEIDRVVGFELGAEDYLVKPYSVRELLMRVRAVLRRCGGGGARAGAVSFGVLRVDLDAHRVWVEEEEIALTAIEYRLLVLFLERRNRVQSRAALLRDVWEIEADITTRTVDTHVKRLREKLGPAGQYVETVRGVGYRFAEAP